MIIIVLFHIVGSFMFQKSLAHDNVSGVCNILKQCGLSSEDLMVYHGYIMIWQINIWL